MSDKWRQDDEANRAYFDNRARLYGADVRSADWGSRESQYRRFEVLAQVDHLQGRSVLDVGCGTGEFLAFLRGSGIDVEYSGVDLSSQALATARERFPGVTFAEGSVLDLEKLFPRQFDHVFTSGIFTRRQRDGEAFVEATVAAMFDRCRRSASFNCLSGWADKKEGDEFHLDPAIAIALGRRHTNRLILRHDYHRADLTVHLYRSPDRS